MSVWNLTPSIAPGGWGNATSDIWRNWKPEYPKNKASGLAIISPKNSASKFLEEVRPTKKRALAKGKLLDLLSKDIINGIGIWLTILEYSKKIKAAMTQIKNPYNPVLHTCAYKDW